MSTVNQEKRDTMTATMGASETGLPYVISADAGGLMRKFERRQNTMLRAPSEAFFNDLALELKSQVGYVTGHEVVLVNQLELHRGMEELVIASEVPVVSLDRAYFSDTDENITAHIDATRAVDPNFMDLGLRPRPGAAELDTQLDKAAAAIEGGEFALADDVIFTARGALELTSKMADRGKKLVKIIAGIAIGGGKMELEASGIQVQNVHAYEAVLDEVCERDFLAGIPMSGRTVYDPENSDGWWSAPYFQPFGNAEKWASIPHDKVADFSVYCLTQSIELWRAVGLASGRPIMVGELPRPLAMVAAEDEQAVGALKRVYESMEIN